MARDTNPDQTSRRGLIQVALYGVLGTLIGISGCAKPGQATKQHSTREATADRSAPRTSGQAQADEAVDQEMDRFTIAGFDSEGAKRWEMEGRGAELNGQTVTILDPEAVGYEKPAGPHPEQPLRTAYLTASVAQIQQNSRRVRMEHDVTIHTSDGLWLRSQVLYWLPDRDEVVTAHPVRFETDRMLVLGRGAHGFTQLKMIVIERDVEVVISSRVRGGEDTGERAPVIIRSDGPMTFDELRNIVTFTENVHVRDRGGDLYADRLVVYLDEQSHRVTYADAMGNVTILQGPHSAHGQRAIYEFDDRTVTLVGSPSLLVFPDEDRGPAAPASVRVGTRIAPETGVGSQVVLRSESL